MTQSAVSKQVAQLEAQLGVSLFYRTSQQIFLSPVGQSYYLDVLKILQQLQSATIDLMARCDEVQTLDIISHPTLCAQWLIPAIKGFDEAYPLIHLHIKEQTEPFLQAGAMAVDMAFLFGDGVWAGMEAVKLFDEQCVAVSAPNYLSDKLDDGYDLVRYPLLRISSRPSAWYDYFFEQGYNKRFILTGAKFDSFYACINAAKIGCGVALVPIRFVEQELAQGDLVLAWHYRMMSKSAYYMAYQSHLKHTPKIQAMLTWIQNYLKARSSV